LVRQLEKALTDRLGLPDKALRTVSNGTSAIEVAILATAGPAKPQRPYALMPSYTFAATGLAAERCGYRPIFCDVDPQNWSMDLDLAAQHPLLDEIGVFVPVAPYGRVPQMRAAEALLAKTGIPVVVDAAASFERLLDDPGLISKTVPMTISFHATKTFSTAEGGAVVWDNETGQDAVVQAANFGFNFSRRSESAGTNAKMSEIHAAVGLAMLDGFDQRRLDYAQTVAHWGEALANVPGRLHLPPDLASVYIMLETTDAAAMERAIDGLTLANIDSRSWYERGLHQQPHFRRMSNTEALTQSLSVTEDIGARLLGLPMAHDLSRADMDRVVKVLIGCL
jgi:dTDP-4-amino-4,6-dideoxygalactose transaminase